MPGAFVVDNTADTLDRLKQLLKGSRPFYWDRFGDGEMMCAAGINSGEHATSVALQQELEEAFALHDKNGYQTALAMHAHEPGMRDGLFAPWTHPKYREWVQARTDQGLFANAIALHYHAVFYPRELRAFLDTHVRPRPKIVVGGQRSPPDWLGKINSYIRIPRFNAYATINDWYPSLVETIERWDTPEDPEDSLPMLILCAGVASSAVNKRLYREDIEVQSIDAFGSMMDLMNREFARTWIELALERQPDLPELIRGKNRA